MPTTFSRRSLLAGISYLGAAGLLSGCGTAGVKVRNGRPSQMVWSTYSVGTGTYNDTAAIANAITNHKSIQVRLLSADTGVGRIAPVINGTTQFARTSVEYYYAFEGEDEFCSAVWGPQPIRLVWAPPGNYGIFVRRDSGIETVEDLRGRRVPDLIASTAVNRNVTAMLNYGGLTRADVENVRIGYGEQTNALASGQVEVMFNNPSGAAVQELASRFDLRWLDFSDTDSSRFETWDRLVPMVTTGPLGQVPGVKEGEEIHNLVYSLPIVTIAERGADEVRSLIQLFAQLFDVYKDATPDAHNFSPDAVMLTPLVVPFHEGSISYFKSIGRWTQGLQRRNDALLEREGLLAEAWPAFWGEHSKNENVSDAWKDWKRENLPELPAVEDQPDTSGLRAQGETQ